MKINQKMWYGILIFIVISSLVININVSLNEKLIFGDEGYYASRAKYIADNWEIPIENTIYGDKPNSGYFFKEPLLFLSLSLIYSLFGKLGMRAFLPIVSVITALLIFKLTEEMYSLRAGVFASLIFLFMPSLITHTIFLYTEAYALMFTVGSVLFLYRYFESEGWGNLLISSVFLGLSALTEATCVIMIPLFFIILFIYKVNYKAFIKEFLVVVSITFIILSPWAIFHNYMNTGMFGFKTQRVLGRPDNSHKFMGNLTDINTEGLKKPTEVSGGSQASLHRFGILNYVSFAYTLPFFLLAILGLSYYLLNLKRKHLIIIGWALIVFSSVYLLMSGARSEDLARNTLFVVVPLSVCAGFFVDKLYDYFEFIESYGKVLKLIFLVILISFTLYTGYIKAGSLRGVKQFSDSFYQGCDWVKKNTPKDSVIYTLWGHRVEYHCERTPVGNSAYKVGDALRLRNNTTYDIFKRHGVDYFYIQKFSIRKGWHRVSYPSKFVQYVFGDEHYDLVYQYPKGCFGNQRSRDCVAVFEVD